MSRTQKVVLVLILSTLILGGLNMWQSSGEDEYEKNGSTEKVDPNDDRDNSKPTEEEAEMNAYEQENYVPIQEYTGEGFTLRDANPKTGEIAEENREEVEKAVEDFFLDDYKTEVKVHNIVSAIDGVSVFVESIGEPHFYAFAIVPIDVRNEVVKTDAVWSQEGQVESAIRSGLYVMAYEKEFARLDEFLEEIEAEYPVVGMNIEVAENVKGNGYRTPYYFPKTSFKPMYEKYLEEPEITREEIKSFLDDEGFIPSKMSRITIRFYTEDSSVEPNEKLYDEIYNKLKDIEGIPGGRYTLILNDNYINRKSAIGEKENSINKTSPDKMEKK